LVHSVRKIRIMGSAALALTYVASGRFDAYIERGIRLWDIAAGGLIVECAGGKFSHDSIEEDYAYRMISSNAILHPRLRIPE
jgi:fructose-1,6-bisphosphatase/inositol monophosphatase family enzyme